MYVPKVNNLLLILWYMQHNIPMMGNGQIQAMVIIIIFQNNHCSYALIIQVKYYHHTSTNQSCKFKIIIKQNEI